MLNTNLLINLDKIGKQEEEEIIEETTIEDLEEIMVSTETTEMIEDQGKIEDPERIEDLEKTEHLDKIEDPEKIEVPEKIEDLDKTTSRE